jgi:hypothetical protein
MTSLMTFKEMKERYKRGEDSLDLTLDKWMRIKIFAEGAFHLCHFQEALEAATIPILLCIEYQQRCRFCPIHRVCEGGKAQQWVTLMRVLKAYALAGDILPREPLIGSVNTFVEELRHCKEDSLGKGN